MKYYTAKIRLNGRTENEVLRHNLSAPEVILLNVIHGGAAIAKLEETGDTAFSTTQHRQERKRLEDTYGRKKEIADEIQRLFGGVTSMLPESTTLDDLRPVENDMYEDGNDAPPVAEAPKAPETVEDPIVAVKASIKELGGRLPRGADLETARTILRELQAQVNNIPAEPEEQPTLESVL